MVYFDFQEPEFGWNQPIVVELPDAIKAYLAQWSKAKIDLTKLAKLRWIEKRKTPELCKTFGLGRTTIRQAIRTIRKCGFSELNLTADEQKAIAEQLQREEQNYGGRYK